MPFASFGQDTYKEFSLEVNFQDFFFFEKPPTDTAGGVDFSEQERNYMSIAIQPEFYYEWGGGANNINFTGFARLDQYDENRTHWDIRELYYQHVHGAWDISVGLKKIYWGVAESNHLVDIINQTDIVESFDGEEKLGQPMTHFSYISAIGTFDLFYLPYFRVPTFAGSAGRLRPGFVIDGDAIGFESSAKEWHQDFAARWSTLIGPIDIGVSHFYGTSRLPVLKDFDFSQPFNFVIINQTSLDLQATIGPLLLKSESIIQTNDVRDAIATVGGFEYTFGNVGNTGLDIGLIGEYTYDDRDNTVFNSLNNDIFYGTRLAFNDIQSTEFIAGGIVDLERGNTLYSVEGARRFGNSWKAELEARIFGDISQEPEDIEFVTFIEQDSFMKFSLSKFF